MYVCATVELVSWRIKHNKTEDYMHKCNRRPSCEKKKNDIKL